MTAKIYPLPDLQIVPKNLGIENIKASFGFLLDVTNKGIQLINQFSWPGAVDLGFTLASAQGMKAAFKKALEEFRDLDAKESVEVSVYVQEHFDISNDELEAAIEEAIDLLPEIYNTLRQNIATYQKVRNYISRFKRVFSPAPATVSLRRDQVA